MSLVEMAVIMIVIGAITFIMLPLMSNMFLAVSDTKKARQLAMVLGQARNMAIGHNAELLFEFDLQSDPDKSDAYEGFILGRSSAGLHRIAKIKRTSINLIGVRSGSGELIKQGKLVIHFMPNGVSQQAYIYVGEESDDLAAIVLTDRYLGTARVFKDEKTVWEYQQKNLIDEEWVHEQH